MSTHDYVTYEEWGRNFFEVAVTEERVAAAFADIAGDEFEMGPMAQGPGKIARVSAKVKIREPKATRQTRGHHHVRHPHPARDRPAGRPAASTSSDSSSTARLPCAPQRAPPNRCCSSSTSPNHGPSDISVHVSTKSLRGEMLRIIGGVDSEIRRFIAQHVADQIDAPESQQAQVINVEEMIDSAWTGI